MAWEYPEPRTGWRGEFDRFMGPGATRAELALELGFAVLGGAAMLIYALTSFPLWSIIQIGVAVLLAFDIAGGVVTNATSSAKRWYHRAGQGARQHLQFVALHIVHVIIVAWLDAAISVVREVIEVSGRAKRPGRVGQSWWAKVRAGGAS